MHTAMVWVFIAVVVIFVVITLIALENSAKRHGRELIPSKREAKLKNEVP